MRDKKKRYVSFFSLVRGKLGKISSETVSGCGRCTIYRRSGREEKWGGHERLGGLHRVAPSRAIDHQLAKITVIRKLLDKLCNFLTCTVRSSDVYLMDTTWTHAIRDCQTVRNAQRQFPNGVHGRQTFAKSIYNGYALPCRSEIQSRNKRSWERSNCAW